MAFWFARCMGIIYFIAFSSLAVQVLGLIGSNGILPVEQFFKQFPSHWGLRRFLVAPTLVWFSHSNAFLLFLCWGGALVSILMAAGIARGAMAFVAWVFYLSLTTVGQEFLGFQWDNLLLEAGFLMIFLYPNPFAIEIMKPIQAPSVVVIWLLRILLFKLMFQSGLVKILSADQNWTGLTALTYHYWSQPLPHFVSWYVDQWPLMFHKFCCAVMFFIELVLPFFIFFGKICRRVIFWIFVIFQFLIILTGNYGFFNLLTIVLCLTLLENKNEGLATSGRVHKVVAIVLAVIIGFVTLIQNAARFRAPLPQPLYKVLQVISPWRSINNYGLFSVMTIEREEIVIEGSQDGKNWAPYEFHWKPGDIYYPPQWAAPHQPRLDWQMWFASLGTWRDNPWLISVMARLLAGEKDVTKLFKMNPYEFQPPKYVRAVKWEYRFTTFGQRNATGHWWQRTYKGEYCPTLSLKH